jgi:hypothetical protein
MKRAHSASMIRSTSNLPRGCSLHRPRPPSSWVDQFRATGFGHHSPGPAREGGAANRP